MLQHIDAANYDEHLTQLLVDCDLVIEAIAERMDWKNDLYAKIAPFLSSTAIVASNTSGLSMNALAQGMPEALRPRFCGIHFFNPPRYMRAGRDHRHRRHRSRRARRARNLAGFAPRQGRHPRPRYAELRRQPYRRLLHPGGDAPHAALRPRLRYGRRADRPENRPPEAAPPTARPTSSASTRWPTSCARCATPCLTTPGTPLHGAGLAGCADRQGRARPEGRRRYLPQGRQGNPRPRSRRAGVPTVGRRARAPKSPPSSRNGISRRASQRCALPTIRRRSSCGPSSATSSITARCNSATSPTMPATSISRCAGASAGPWGRSRPGRPPAGKTIARAIAADIAAGKAMSDAPLPAWVLQAGRTGVHAR